MANQRVEEIAEGLQAEQTELTGNEEEQQAEGEQQQEEAAETQPEEEQQADKPLEEKGKEQEQDFEAVKWVQKRLKRQEQQHKRDLQEIAQNMQSQFMQTLQQSNVLPTNVGMPAQQSVANGQGDDIDQRVNVAVNNIFQQQQEQKRQVEEKARDAEFAAQAAKMAEK